MAGKILAELGADVVRLLPGERGPDLDGPDEPGLLDLWHDARCRSAVLDLEDPDDAARFRAAVARCEVLLDARPPGAMARLGLGPDELSAINPRLVHVTLTPQGSDGPRAGWRSSDLVAQALGGYLSVTGDPDHPIALWGRQAATLGGFYAAMSALAGVHRLRVTGAGSWVDLSLHQAVVSCSEHLLMYWWFPEALAPLGAPIAPRQRSLHWVRAFEVVPCRRGACMVSPAAGGLLALIAWLKARGHAQSVPDEPDAEQLLTIIPPLMEALHAVALETDATELFEAGQSLHVPFGEAYSIAQVATCDQHIQRGYFRPVEIDRGEPGDDRDLRLPGPLARFERTPAPPPTAPRLIDRTDLTELWSEPTTTADRGGRDDNAADQETADRGGSDDAADRDPDTGTDDEAADRDPDTGTDDEAADRDPDTGTDDAGPLAGIRVLDFTHVLAGPFATRNLADLGADVIRVQTDERSAGTAANEFPYNVMWGRSKRSIQLHMKHPEARDVLRRLVERADVVIDNFSAGVMAGWGAGPEQLAEWNPSIVSVSMSGCGADGPWQSYVTYAPTIHALCGLTALTGPKGETDCGPGIAFNDHVSGLAGAACLLAALEHRNLTGRGQHIDLSQFEIGTYLVGPAVVDHLATGRLAESNGNVDPFAPHLVNDVFRCADGDWLAVTVVDAADRERAAAVGLDPEGEPTATIRRWAADRDAVDAQDLLQGAGVAAGVVQNAQHLMSDPQLAHRDWLVTMDSPMLGSQTTERHPARWYSGGRELTLAYRPTAYLGEHNFEVYEQVLDWDAERIATAIGDELIL